MKDGVYGLQSFKMQNALASGFPSSWEGSGVYNLKAIIKDSFTYNDQAASENDIEVEDMSTFYASLPSTQASKGFTIQTYDMSRDAYLYLCKYEKNNSTGYYEETGNTLANQAVQFITKDYADFPSKTFEFANMTCKVTRAGNIGKSGFPNFNLEFKQVVNTDGSGNEISGARWKYTDPTDDPSYTPPVGGE